MHTLRIARIAVALSVATVSIAIAQSPPQPGSKLSNVERAELQVLIDRVDAVMRGDAPAAPSPAQWDVQAMQTSDGLTYLPFSLIFDATAPPDGLVYVRVVTRGAGAGERSALAAWLLEDAKRGLPPPKKVSGAMSVPAGEMPVGGVATRGRSSDVGEASAALSLMEKERQRIREAERRREEERKSDRKREDAAILTRQPDRSVYPFEDFDFRPDLARFGATRVALRRAVTAPAGEYDLYIALAERAKSGKNVGKTPITILKRTITAPATIPGELAVSSIIVGETAVELSAPYPPERQASHPYAFGWTEVAPSPAAEFRDEDRLVAAFQAINPRPNLLAKPDLTATYRIYRTGGGPDALIRTAGVRAFNASTLPGDFDLSKGHQVFAIHAIPLKGIGAGEHRLEITLADRLASTTAVANVAFAVVGSPADLLRAAPALPGPIRTSDALSRAVLDAMLPPPPEGASPALVAALRAARDGQFASVIGFDASAEREHAALAAIVRGVALLSVGDAVAGAADLFARATAAAPSIAAGWFYLGVSRALQGRDLDALAAWQAPAVTSLGAPTTSAFIIDAHLRLREPEKAAAALDAARTTHPHDPALARASATMLLSNGRTAEALSLLDAHLATHGGDAAARVLALRALLGAYVATQSADAGARLVAEGRAFASGGAPDGAIVTAWVRAIERDTKLRSEKK